MPNCRDCDAPIKFARFNGTTLPVDAQSDCHEGNLVLFHEHSILTARPAHLPRDYSRPRHRLHFDTCKKRRYRKASQR